jgi:hypothetical protein
MVALLLTLGIVAIMALGLVGTALFPLIAPLIAILTLA